MNREPVNQSVEHRRQFIDSVFDQMQDHGSQEELIALAAQNQPEWNAAARTGRNQRVARRHTAKEKQIAGFLEASAGSIRRRNDRIVENEAPIEEAEESPEGGPSPNLDDLQELGLLSRQKSAEGDLQYLAQSTIQTEAHNQLQPLTPRQFLASPSATAIGQARRAEGPFSVAPAASLHSGPQQQRGTDSP